MKKLICLLFCLFFILGIICTPVRAEIYAISLANNAPEPWRKKEGDIISVKNYGVAWGSATRKQCLIILVDFGANVTQLNNAKTLMIPLYESGDLMTPEIPDVNIIAQNRFKISFDSIDYIARSKNMDINWTSVRNETVDYQPFLDGDIIFQWNDLIFDKFRDRNLTSNDLAIINSVDE